MKICASHFPEERQDGEEGNSTNGAKWRNILWVISPKTNSAATSQAERRHRELEQKNSLNNLGLTFRRDTDMSFVNMLSSASNRIDSS